jgi:uncharacterized membrane protein YeaQ/YmgE (transglycosylase-associated protein family)
MGIIAWIILGLIAGAIAKAIYPGHQGGGILGTMLLGVIGAFVGGALHSLLTTGALQLVGVSFSLGGILLAIVGAIIAVFVWSLLTRTA